MLSLTLVAHTASAFRMPSVTMVANGLEIAHRSRIVLHAEHAVAKLSSRCSTRPSMPTSSIWLPCRISRAPSRIHSKRGKRPPPSSQNVFHCEGSSIVDAMDMARCLMSLFILSECRESLSGNEIRVSPEISSLGLCAFELPTSSLIELGTDGVTDIGGGVGGRTLMSRIRSFLLADNNVTASSSSRTRSSSRSKGETSSLSWVRFISLPIKLFSISIIPSSAI
mmetsp:Transcript_12029/g.14128  ORF Transcript_12029/g.14128 Transcript_12029/m.14128 type:complete len:224 (+) Transcript_12029:254-925(+)